MGLMRRTDCRLLRGVMSIVELLLALVKRLL